MRRIVSCSLLLALAATAGAEPAQTELEPAVTFKTISSHPCALAWGHVLPGRTHAMNDLYPDLAVAGGYNEAIGSSEGAGTVTIFVNTGQWDPTSAGLLPVQHLVVSRTESVVGVAFAEVNDDGHVDLIALTLDGRAHVFFNDGYGSYLTAQTDSASLDELRAIKDLAPVADMLAAAMPSESHETSGEANSATTQRSDGDVAGNPAREKSASVLVVDLNRDGLDDVVVANNAQRSLSVRIRRTAPEED